MTVATTENQTQTTRDEKNAGNMLMERDAYEYWMSRVPGAYSFRDYLPDHMVRAFREILDRPLTLFELELLVSVDSNDLECMCPHKRSKFTAIRWIDPRENDDLLAFVARYGNVGDAITAAGDALIERGSFYLDTTRPDPFLALPVPVSGRPFSYNGKKVVLAQHSALVKVATSMGSVQVPKWGHSAAHIHRIQEEVLEPRRAAAKAEAMTRAKREHGEGLGCVSVSKS